MVHKSRFLTFILSWVPGLGHLYLGLNRRGLQFMAAAFACIVLITIIPIVFPFVLAIIWFYSLFDALQKAAMINACATDRGEQASTEDPFLGMRGIVSELDQTVIPLDQFQGKHAVAPAWIGGLCILVGALVLIREIFPSIWSVLVNAHLGSFFLAVILIAFGVWLIRMQVKRNK